jgi:hypothetical protein
MCVARRNLVADGPRDFDGLPKPFHASRNRVSVPQVWLKQVKLVSRALRTSDIGARYEARRIIANKNSLSAADAERGERAFQEWLASIARPRSLLKRLSQEETHSMSRAVG